MIVFDLLYLISASALAVYGLHALAHAWLFWRMPRRQGQPPAITDLAAADLPAVTVQLPIFNERHVAARLLNAVAALDWPRDRLQIQVLDDSTDDTSEIVADLVRRLAERGLTVHHIRRGDRQGYKAGALQHGLATARGHFIAIFDADFVPPPDFLRRLVPEFADPAVGCAQARWGHLNAATSQLTDVQALGIDGHFVVEQHVRSQHGAFLNFNGTAGVWRRACMDAVGGWQGDTLTEDLDLSYRAQLAGWRIVYRPDVVAPAELPVQIDAFKRQQFRWAKGSLQTARKLLGQVWRTPLPLWKKVQGTLHLTNYLVHPLMVANLVLLLPISLTSSPLLRLAFLLTLAAVGPPLLYWTAARQPGGGGPRLRRLAVLMAVGTGLSLNNSRAALEAATGVASEFKRTPKFALVDRTNAWQASSYALPRDPVVWAELALALYAAGLLLFYLGAGKWWMLPWVLLYLAGYGYVAGLAFVQAWQVNARRRAHSDPGRAPAAAAAWDES